MIGQLIGSRASHVNTKNSRGRGKNTLQFEKNSLLTQENFNDPQLAGKSPGQQKSNHTDFDLQPLGDWGRVFSTFQTWHEFLYCNQSQSKEFYFSMIGRFTSNIITGQYTYIYVTFFIVFIIQELYYAFSTHKFLFLRVFSRLKSRYQQRHVLLGRKRCRCGGPGQVM